MGKIWLFTGMDGQIANRFAADRAMDRPKRALTAIPLSPPSNRPNNAACRSSADLRCANNSCDAFRADTHKRPRERDARAANGNPQSSTGRHEEAARRTKQVSERACLEAVAGLVEAGSDAAGWAGVLVGPAILILIVDGFRGCRDGGGPIQLTKLTGSRTIDTPGSPIHHTPVKTQRRRCKL